MKLPPAGDTSDGAQDDAERRAEAFLEKVRINVVLYQTRANARNVEHDEPWQAHGCRSSGRTGAAQINQVEPTDITEGSYARLRKFT